MTIKMHRLKCGALFFVGIVSLDSIKPPLGATKGRWIFATGKKTEGMRSFSKLLSFLFPKTFSLPQSASLTAPSSEGAFSCFPKCELPAGQERAIRTINHQVEPFYAHIRKTAEAVSRFGCFISCKA